MSKVLPETAIIIPTCGRPGSLKRCLSSIVPYANQHPGCTIVVSDDGDAGETKLAIGSEFERVRVVQGPRRGPAANRNFGAASCDAALLIFLDDDCIPDPELVRCYREAAAQDPGTHVFEGRTSPVGASTGFGDLCPVNETGGYLWSCNFAIRRELFTSVGGFDERFRFPAMEDVDLRFRVKGASAIRFLPEARVLHPFERRLGWKLLKHQALSAMLYSHLRGLKQTALGPTYRIRVLYHLVVEGGVRLLRNDRARDPQQLLRMIWFNIEMLIITLFWRFHPHLAKAFFPPCCAGCHSIFADLADG